MRQLRQDAGAIAGVGLAATSAAMLQIVQYVQRLPDNAMGALPLDMGDKANATGVVLEGGVI